MKKLLTWVFLFLMFTVIATVFTRAFEFPWSLLICFVTGMLVGVVWPYTEVHKFLWREEYYPDEHR